MLQTTRKMPKYSLGSCCKRVAGVLKNMSHPERLQILCCLADGPMTVNQLLEHCEASQPLVSQFLIRMRAEGVLKFEKKGRNVYYEIADPDTRKLIQSLYRIYCA